MSTKKEPAWHWNENPIDKDPARELIDDLMEEGTIYDKTDYRPMCYPGTVLNPALLSEIDILELMRQMHNNIGSHTHGTLEKNKFKPDDGEGGFDFTHKAEREVIWMIAKQLGAGVNAPVPEEIDGHFCGGGTEANLTGMWVARQYLRKRPDPYKRGVCVLTTPMVHYSIPKASAILDIGMSKWEHCHFCGTDHLLVTEPSGAGVNVVGADAYGRMDMSSLKRVFERKYNEGFRRFIVVCTAGTCAMGSIDPIAKISDWIGKKERELRVSFYMHVDASFGGFTIPFAHEPGTGAHEDRPKIGFDVKHVMSMTLDADKMGHLPYPAGIFLCRKDLQRLVARSVAYVRGNNDNTVPGSRSALPALLAHYWYRRIGLNGHRVFVQQCMRARDYLADLIRERFGADHEVIKIAYQPGYTNFLPVFINIEDGKIPSYLLEDGKKHQKARKKAGFKKETTLAPYHLRGDRLPSKPGDPESCPKTVYKLCIMPHLAGSENEKYLNRFIDDLAKVVEEHEARKK